MNFTQAVRRCLTQYATFQGRASRSEYWWFFLACFSTSLACAFINNGLMAAMFLVQFLPALAVTVRRLHDSGLSGWWYLAAVVPFLGSVVLLGLMLLKGDPSPNRFGQPESRGTAATNP